MERLEKDLRITLGFSTNQNWVSRVIRFFTRSKISHTFLVIESLTFPTLICEAAWCGWRLSSLSSLLKGNTLEYLIEPKVSLENSFFDSLTWLGEQYNYTGLLGMAYVAIGRWLDKKWQNPMRNSSSMFCSEAAVYVLDDANYPASNLLDPQSTSPEDLLEFLLNTDSKETKLLGS